MWIPVSISLRSYIPKKLELGMWFLKNVNGEPFVFKLKEIPQNPTEFINEVGYPVEPFIVDIGDPHNDVETVIADSDQVGWFDEGEFTDELVDIEPSHVNRIFSGYNGWLAMEMEEDDEGDLVPVLYENKVCLAYPEDPEELED